MRSVHERLREAMNSRRPVHFDVSIPGVTAYSGFLLGLGPEWLLLHYLNDFRLDGYRLLRVSDIERLRSRHSQKTFERIYREEGITDKVGPPPYPVSCENLPAALQDLKTAGKNVIVRAEHPDDDIFFIGSLSRIGKKKVSGRYFDATGKWETEDTKIPYDCITCVDIECEYVRVFSKYTHH
ncbi:MAG: hypothetical protein RBU21_05800 [FCB group bacterium]|jgi:hypothetical protein|nr:hypothetical protein [FCB group bacterium]